MTHVIYYAADGRLTPRATERLRRARWLVYGEDEVDFVEVEPGPGALNFGYFPELPDGSVRTLSFKEIEAVHRAEYFVAAAMRRYKGDFEYRSPKPGANVLWFDTEAYSVDERWDMDPRDYTRLFQYSWNDDPEVHFVYDYDEMIDLIEQADLSSAHQGHGFDWSTLYGKESTRPLELAREGRLWDTKTHASVNFPAPPGYVKRNGLYQIEADTPENAKHGWLSLDNLAYQFGVPGKMGDLKALADEFGGFGSIPLDDPRFEDYARQDVHTLRGIASAMLQFAMVDRYDWREQRTAGAINAQIARNGVRIDVAKAEARIAVLEDRKNELLSRLVKDYGFPEVGKKPWSSKIGRQALISILKDGGIDPETDPDWPQGKTGPSLGGKVLGALLRGTPLEETGTLLAELMGQRPLAQQALNFLRSDGKVHPEYETFQRSGRTSVTEPGLTTWGNRNEALRVEKEYFVPDNDDELLVEFDFSQADARMVAAYSGDTNYAELFAPGKDMHETRARAVFGNERYDSNPRKFRDDIKPINHGGNYGLGKVKLARMLKVSVEEAGKILDDDSKFYSVVTEWKVLARALAKAGFIVNGWGRVVPITRGQEYTQAPAMYGQSGTRELMFDALDRMLHYDIRLIKWLKMTVHDALVFSIPKEHLDWAVPTIKDLMYCKWGPQGSGQVIEFPAEVGKPGRNWSEASH